MMPRYLMLRRFTQALVVLLFFGTAHWSWTLAGVPLLRGDLSASEIAGKVPLADPYAALQILATGHLPGLRVLVGAAIVLLFYALWGGRMFCAWVCPLNPVSDLAGWLRKRWGLDDGMRLSRKVRVWILALSFPLSALVSVAAFEWISPIGMAHRAVIFSAGFAWVAVTGVFLFDLLFVKNGWCGHLCPLGAFYGLFGRVAQLRIGYDVDSCTHCGECTLVCPEPHVLNLKLAARRGMVDWGDCTNCGRCIPVCPESSLRFAWRRQCKTGVVTPSSGISHEE